MAHPVAQTDTAGPTPARLAGRSAILFAATFVIALLLAVAWNGGPRFFVERPTVEVPASTFVAVRGRGRVETARYLVDAVDAEGIALVAAGGATFAAADYPRITWHLMWDVPPGLQLNIAWRRRDTPGRLHSEPIEWSRGPAYIDLNGHPEWSGTIQELALAIRGPVRSPVVIGGVTLRSAAWSATLVDTLSDWRNRAMFVVPGNFLLMSGERSAIAPLVPTVAAAVALAIAFLAWRARRRGQRFPLASAVAVFLAGSLVLDLRLSVHFAAQHAANLVQYGGKSGDEKTAAGPDGALFLAARRLRDAPRERPARVIVLSDNGHLATRTGWFFYPDNVWYDPTTRRRRTVPAPDQLRPGDQVVLLLYEGIAWDAARNLLVWRDGRSRPARAILIDGPAFAMVRVE